MKTDEGLRRQIGLGGLTANILNTVIGAGIFVLPAVVSKDLGAAGLLAYLFCGFLMTMILLCFAEVGSRVTVTGGAYAYIEAAFGKYAGFITTNLFIIGASLMATAAVANAVADTLAYPFPLFADKGVRAVFFVLLFAGLTIINVRGVTHGVNLVKATTLAKLAPLLLFICWGAMHIEGRSLSWQEAPGWESFGKVSLLLFFAFQGAENSLSVSGEVKNPQKTIPYSILLSTACVLVIYIAVQLVAQGVLGNSLADFKGAPLAEAARKIMGPIGKPLMLTGAAVSMFGYLSSDVLNMPRVIFRSAKDRVIPVEALARVHPRFATPHVSVIVFTALGCFLSIAGGFRQLAVLSTASVLLIYLGVALAFIKLRRRPDAAASFKLPGGYAVPLISILIIGWFLTNLAKREWIGMLIFLAVLSGVYFIMQFFPKGRKPR
ncbi:MAG: amino acid permease [Williamsia sp.]|nr:amino acid permease [Williamsia sp.]